MKKGIIFYALALLSFSSMAWADPIQSMDKEQLTKTFSDKTINTIALTTLNNQLINDAVSVYFDPKGHVVGKFSSKPQNAAQNDQGAWEVKPKGVLCVTWQHWHEGKPICVVAYNLKNGILFVNQDNNKFETLVLKEGIKFGNQVR